MYTIRPWISNNAFYPKAHSTFMHMSIWSFLELQCEHFMAWISSHTALLKELSWLTESTLHTLNGFLWSQEYSFPPAQMPPRRVNWWLGWGWEQGMITCILVLTFRLPPPYLYTIRCRDVTCPFKCVCHISQDFHRHQKVTCIEIFPLG